MERNVERRVTVAESIKSLLIKIIDFVDTRTLANCKKISCTGHDKLCIPPAWVHLQWLRPSRTSSRRFLQFIHIHRTIL